MSVLIKNEKDKEIEVCRFNDKLELCITDRDMSLCFVFDSMYDVDFFLSRVTGCIKSIKKDDIRNNTGIKPTIKIKH
jgi:hypothetical protein